MERRAAVTMAMSTAVGGNEALLCNPAEREIWGRVDDAILNLVEAGLVFELDDGRCLPVFAVDNSAFLADAGVDGGPCAMDRLRERYPAYRFAPL